MQRSGTGHVQFSRNLRGGTAPQKLQSQSPASLILETFDEQDETKFEPRGIKQLPTPATRTQKSVKSQKRSRSAPAASKKGDRNDRSSTEGKSKLSPQSVASTLLRSSLRRRSRSNTSRKQQQYPYPQKEVQNEQESKDAPRVSNVPGARPHRRSLSLVGNMSPQPQPKKKPSSPRGRSGSPRRILSSFGKILSSISRNASPSRDSQRASMANGGGSGDGDVNGHTSTGAMRDQTPVKDTSLDDFVESQSNGSASSPTATKTNEATALSRGKKISSMKDHMERPKFASISAPMQEASIVQTRDDETRDTGATPEASLRTNSRIGSSECAGRSARSPRSSMVSRVLNAGGLRGRSKLANRPRPHAATTTTTSSSSSSSSSSTSSSQQPRASPIPPRSLLQRGRPRQRTPVAGGGGKRRNVGRSGNGGPSWSPTPKKRSVSGSPSPRGPKVPVRKSPIARSPARRTPPQASPSQRSGRSTSPRSKSPNAANAEADGAAAKSANNRAPPDITALAMHKATSSSSPRRSQRTPLKTRPVDARGAKKEAIAIDGDGGTTMAQEEPSEENPRRAAEGLERVEPRSRPLPVPIERDIAMIPDTLPPAVVACEDISKLSLDEALQRQQRRSDGTDHVLGALRSARTISTPENHPLSVGAVKKSPGVSNQPRTTKSRAVASPHSSPPRITSARPMSPKALAQLPREVNPYQSSSSSSPRTVPSDFANSGESNSALNNGNRSGKSKEQPIITFDGTFRGWTYSSRPEIRLADLVAVDFLGMGHFGQVKCVRWQPKDGSGSRSAGRSPGKDDDDRDGRYKSNGSNVVKRLFALKIMERERFENKVVASGRTEEYYIFNEREIMIDIKSPFHIRLLNTYKSAKNLYMLLEYAPGRNLKDQIDRDMGLTMFGGADANVWSSSSSLDITDATSDLSSEHLEASLSRIKFYAANIVLALRHLHERQIMHRDIKPSNILIDTHGYLKICDYGFARWMAIGEKTGSIAGTYNYLTPEQAVDDEYDHSVDLWCLGVTIYNMCYGVTPFEAPEGTDDWQQVTVDNILNRRVRFLDDRKPLPLAGKMLVKDLLSRFIEKRLGAKLEYDAILSHAWFRDVDWERLEKREVDAPWHPDLHSMHANLT